MLLVGWAVTDALKRAVSIRRAGLVRIGTDSIFSLFVLPRCPTRLADIYK
jgi:hypothetical protein